MKLTNQKKHSTQTTRTSNSELKKFYRVAELGWHHASLLSLWGCQLLAARKTGQDVVKKCDFTYHTPHGMCANPYRLSPELMLGPLCVHFF